MVLAANTPLTFIRGEQSELPAAAAIIYEGAILGDNGSGYARCLVAGDPFRGHAMEYIDNSAGSEGDQNIKLMRGRYRLEVTLTSVAITDIGKQVFASADDTYTLTPGSNSVVGRVVRYVTINTAIVEFDTSVEESGLSSIIVISPEGSDTEGDGSWLRPYASLTQAMSVVSSTRKTILVIPGTYTETAAVAWSTISGVKLIGLAGQYQTIIAAADTADEVITVAPGAQTSTWEMWIENIYIDHSVAGQDGINIVHTDVGKKLNVYLHNFGGDADSSSDKIITMTHGGDGNAIRVYWDGDNGGVEGQVYMDTEDAGDRLYITDVVLNGGIVSSADAVASNIKLIRCIVKHEGVTGGNGAQTVTAVGCYSETSGTYAILDTDDLAGSHAETIVANA